MTSEQFHDVQVRVIGDRSSLTYHCKFPFKSCQCVVCRRQPPCRFGRQHLVPIHYQLEIFELLTDTTYDLYLFAVRSNRVSTRSLLPPEYPSIRIKYGSHRPDRRRHRHCPVGTVRGRGCTNTFSSLSARSQLWWILRNIHGVISVSKQFSFLPIVGSINRLYYRGSNHML